MATILLADDNEELIKIQAILLRRAGHEVTTASNGREALKLFTNQPADLVITDIIMPDMEGLELIMTLRKTMPTVKIIAMSGGGRGSPADYLSLAQTFGAQATLLKPFTGAELMEVVTKVLGDGGEKKTSA